jgi:Na+-translocating ferredoxin:NAD+ oxidoreductase RNF subunit RnfB
MGLAALASPLRIRRDPSLCIDCAKCAKACPAALPVDRLITIRAAECTGCLECVAVCPAAGALCLSAPARNECQRGRWPPESPRYSWAFADSPVSLVIGTPIFPAAHTSI